MNTHLLIKVEASKLKLLGTNLGGTDSQKLISITQVMLYKESP